LVFPVGVIDSVTVSLMVVTNKER